MKKYLVPMGPMGHLVDLKCTGCLHGIVYYYQFDLSWVSREVDHN